MTNEFPARRYLMNGLLLVAAASFVGVVVFVFARFS